MRIIVDANGRIWRATPTGPFKVVAVVWDQMEGGCVLRGRVVGEASTLHDAERLARQAGFRIRRKAQFVDSVNGIHVDVVEDAGTA